MDSRDTTALLMTTFEHKQAVSPLFPHSHIHYKNDPTLDLKQLGDLLGRDALLQPNQAVTLDQLENEFTELNHFTRNETN